MTSLAHSVAVRRNSGRGRQLFAAALCALLHAAALEAGEKSTALSVTVTVLPVARLQVLSPQQPLQISAQDLERGFVDVVEPLQLSVYSNAAAGYALEVLPLMPLVQSIEVYGLHGQAQLGPGGGRIVQRWNGPQTTSLSLTFRLGLAAGTQPGVYPWPLSLTVQPI
jgi:hypothetical protein